jgi:hypothetical protein
MSPGAISKPPPKRGEVVRFLRSKHDRGGATFDDLCALGIASPEAYVVEMRRDSYEITVTGEGRERRYRLDAEPRDVGRRNLRQQLTIDDVGQP